MFQWTHALEVILQRITTQPRQIWGNSYQIASQTVTWISHSWIKIGQCFCKISSTKRLGVIIDNKLTLNEHVNNVCMAARYQVRALRHVRKYVCEDVVKSIATSLVSARLDYCNAVFYGTSWKTIDKLQGVQNTLARVVKECSKYDHITPLLSELHWLPIEARIRHKIAGLTFKAVSTIKPSYLAELISTHTPAREFRSSSRRPNQLIVPNVRTAFGSPAFRHAAPAVWNSMPSTVTDTAISMETLKSRLQILYTISHSAVNHVTDLHLPFDITDDDIWCDTNCLLLLLLFLMRIPKRCDLWPIEIFKV